MAKIRDFVKRELTGMIAFFAALVSCFFVPPDRAYGDYIDLRTLALLYCLMVVVAGLRRAGVFAVLSDVLLRKAGNVRQISLILVLLCFFSAMFVTNDVALLTFVPFAVSVLLLAGQSRWLILVVVLQTIAANLGSMLTPVGNPQNLYLYSRYGLSMGDFLRVTAPFWLLSLGVCALLCLPIRREALTVDIGERPRVNRGKFRLYGLLFLLCLAVVLRLFDWPVLLGILVAVLLVFDRKMLLSADFMLLLTFVCFFVFSGNLARIPAVNELLRSLLTGRELLVSAAVSQIISNVPAALLLSGFTDNARALLLGVNIGGLGTPVASLASLISLKLYSHAENATPGRYMAVFLGLNFALLALLLGLALIFA